MDKSNIYEALSHLDDQLVADTEKVRQNKKGAADPIYIRIVKSRGTKIVLAAACLALVLGIGGNALFGGGSKKGLLEEFSENSLMAVRSTAPESLDVMMDYLEQEGTYSIAESKDIINYNAGGDDNEIASLETAPGNMITPRDYIVVDWTSINEDRSELSIGFSLSKDAPFYMTCGADYELQRKEADGWSTVEPESPLFFDMMLRIVGNKTDGNFEYNQVVLLSYYKNLQKGNKYRVIKNFSVILDEVGESAPIPYQMSFEFVY